MSHVCTDARDSAQPCVYERPRFGTSYAGWRGTLSMTTCVAFWLFSTPSATCHQHARTCVDIASRELKRPRGGGCTSWRVSTCGFITRSSAAFHCVPRHRRFGVRLTPVCCSKVWCRRCCIHNHKATDSSLARKKRDAVTQVRVRTVVDHTSAHRVCN